MMKMFRKNVSSILDMNEAKILNYSIVLVDNVYNGIASEGKIDIKKYYNPFNELKHLAIKGALHLNFTQISLDDDMNKIYKNGDFTITNQFFPPKLIITQQSNTNDKNLDNTTIVDMTKKIIEFAEISNNIGKIGVNFDCFIETDLIVKDVVMKENIATEFTGVSFTLEKKLNDLQKLILQIAGSKNIETNKNGVFIQANFDNTITTTNTIDKILNQDYISMLQPSIDAIF